MQIAPGMRLHSDISKGGVSNKGVSVWDVFWPEIQKTNLSLQRCF
jgi:hypothetical protein